MSEEKQTDDLPDFLGGLGGILREHGIRDTRLLEFAAKNCFPVEHEHKAAIVRRQVRIAIDPNSSPREATSAARCIAMFTGQNLQIILKIIDKIQADKHEHEHHNSEIAELLNQFREDENYARLERERAVADSGESGANGHNGQSGKVGDVKSPRYRR